MPTWILSASEGTPRMSAIAISISQLRRRDMPAAETDPQQEKVTNAISCRPASAGHSAGILQGWTHCADLTENQLFASHSGNVAPNSAGEKGQTESKSNRIAFAAQYLLFADSLNERISSQPDDGVGSQIIQPSVFPPT